MKRVALDVPVDKLAQEYEITIESEWVRSNSDPQEGFVGNEFRTTLKRGDKNCVFPFMKSFSMGGDDPNINEVLNYLTQNAKETAGTFEDWRELTEAPEYATMLFSHLKRLGNMTTETLGVEIMNKLIDLTYPEK